MVKSTTEEGKEAWIPKSDDSASEAAATSLLSPSSNLADNNTTLEPSALAASTNALSALWYLIDRFFSAGPSAASYFFVALEASIRHNSNSNNSNSANTVLVVVHPLHIPRPARLLGPTTPSPGPRPEPAWRSSSRSPPRPAPPRPGRLRPLQPEPRRLRRPAARFVLVGNAHHHQRFRIVTPAPSTAPRTTP